jgi:PKD repeat protein
VKRIQLINPTPNVDFSFSGNCLNDSTYFTNLSVLAAGQVIEDKWFFNANNIDFQESTNKNPVIQFVDPGRTIITLRLLTDKGCVSIHRDTLFMRESPVAGFKLDDYCVRQDFTIEDQTNSVDSIVRYQWYLSPNDSSSLQEPTFRRDLPGVYNLKQIVETEYGCLDSTTGQVLINPEPLARFNILNNGSGSPYDLRVANTSLDASQQVWYFGTGDSSMAQVPLYTYTDTGRYDLSLVVSSGIGCVDTAIQELIVSPFKLEAVLERIFLEETFDGRLVVSARIVNSGNNTINDLQLTATLNNDFQFTEQLNQELFKGDRTAYQFSSNFQQGNGKQVDFVCVKIERVNGTLLQESDELCELAFNNEIQFEVFPNPVSEELNMRYVLPQSGRLNYQIYDQMGRLLIDREVGEMEEGLYLNVENVSQLDYGLYHYRFVFNGVSYEGTFVKE